MCGVTECPVTNLFLRQQGVPGAEQGWHQRRPLLLPVISISDARLTYLQRLCKVLLARCFPRCVCFMLNLVTFSPLEGNLVPCEPRLIILETFRLYSRLISCTRKISILHLEFKCVCVCVSEIFLEGTLVERGRPQKSHFVRGSIQKESPTYPFFGTLSRYVRRSHVTISRPLHDSLCVSFRS